MAINSYSNAASGNPTNVHAIVKLLEAHDAVEVLDKIVKTIPVPANKNETINLQRAVTPAVNLNEVSEGVNPPSRALTYENVTKTLEEFAEVFAVTSRQAELGEYDVLMHSKDRLLDLVKRTREQNAWLEYVAGNQVIYNSSAHTLRTQVNGAITIGRLRVIARVLHANRAMLMTEMSNGSTMVGTTPVEPAFAVLSHTDTRNDIRALPGFITAAQIGGSRPKLPNLFGMVDEFAFITSPEFVPFLAGGAAVGATGMKSVGGVSIDVYPFLVLAKEAVGKLNLSSYGAITATVLDKADKSDPTNQRRLVSCRWWDGPIRLDEGWMYRLECGVTDNPA